MSALGLAPAGPTSADSPRPVQMLELAIDTMDIDATRPQRNRAHFDISVAHDEAEARVRGEPDPLKAL